MGELTLKRGWGYSFAGQNWRSAGDGMWSVHRMYVPYGGEPMVGTRPIGGEEHAVFLCRDDEYFAQPVSLCGEPPPDDPFAVVRPPPAEEEHDGWKSSRGSVPILKAMRAQSAKSKSGARVLPSKDKLFAAASRVDEPAPGESVAAGRPAAKDQAGGRGFMGLDQPDEELLALARPMSIRK